MKRNNFPVIQTWLAIHLLGYTKWYWRRETPQPTRHVNKHDNVIRWRMFYGNLGNTFLLLYQNWYNNTLLLCYFQKNTALSPGLHVSDTYIPFHRSYWYDDLLNIGSHHLNSTWTYHVLPTVEYLQPTLQLSFEIIHYVMNKSEVRTLVTEIVLSADLLGNTFIIKKIDPAYIRIVP